MDELTAHIQEEVPQCMLIIDDIMLVDELRDGVNATLERWKEALKPRDFKVSCIKIEYMSCNFSGDVQRDGTPMKIEA